MTLAYGSGAAGGAYPVEGVSLRVERGARVALVGHNGAGKSTILKAAAGLLPVLAGELRLFGHAAGACRHQVAYLPQRSEIDWSFPVSVSAIVLSGRYVHLGWFRRPGRRDRERSREALALLGMAKLADRRIGELSGGQQQRVLLARALVHDADLFLLDEPLNAIDVETRAVVERVLENLRGEGKTVLMATHDLGRQESDFDEALYLSEGRRVEEPPGGLHAH